MEDKWIPVREELPETDDWVQVQTQDGTIYPATFKNNKWVPLFRGGLVEQLMHGKVAYWLPHAQSYPNVQCRCGRYFLQKDGSKTCPICANLYVATHQTTEKPKKAPKAVKQPVEAVELPFAEEEDNPPVDEEDIIF